MISYKTVEALWNEREKHICIHKYFFNEKECKYLRNVLKECNFNHFSCIDSETVCREAKEGYKAGKHYKTLAKELKEEERICESCM